MMHRSTLFFALLSLVLASTTGFVTWRLVQSSREQFVPQIGGSSVQLGLPGVQTDTEGRFTAGSALLWDADAQAIRFEQNGFERRPIASLTKLMTAMVALDHGIDWTKPVTIQSEEYVRGGRLIMQPGETVTMRDLFHASLMASANNATLAYVRELGIPKEEFVREMNRKAIELELEQTEFADVTGLDPDNVSTAYEVARFADIAFRQYPDIAEITSKKEYTFHFGGSDREHTIRNSNKLITDWGEQLSASKTGYLYESKYCLVIQGSGEMTNRIAVILGSPSEVEHLADARNLLHLPVP